MENQGFAKSSSLPGNESISEAPAGKKILIVEDEGVVALDLKHSLENLGYSICGIASSGDAALRKAKATRPDLALVDVKLQGDMDGIETAAAVKWLYHTPVIFLTAHADDETLERAKA